MTTTDLTVTGRLASRMVTTPSKGSTQELVKFLNAKIVEFEEAADPDVHEDDLAASLAEHAFDVRALKLLAIEHISTQVYLHRATSRRSIERAAVKDRERRERDEARRAEWAAVEQKQLERWAESEDLTVEQLVERNRLADEAYEAKQQAQIDEWKREDAEKRERDFQLTVEEWSPWLDSPESYPYDVSHGNDSDTMWKSRGKDHGLNSILKDVARHLDREIDLDWLLRAAEAQRPGDASFRNQTLFAWKHSFEVMRLNVEDLKNSLAAEIRLELTEELLSLEFALGDGVRVTWGEATVDQHKKRVARQVSHAAGTLDDAVRHEAAIRMLDESGAATLSELKAAA